MESNRIKSHDQDGCHAHIWLNCQNPVLYRIIHDSQLANDLEYLVPADNLDHLMVNILLQILKCYLLIRISYCSFHYHCVSIKLKQLTMKLYTFKSKFLENAFVLLACELFQSFCAEKILNLFVTLFIVKIWGMSFC